VPDGFPTPAGSTGPSKGQLLGHDTRAGFSDDVKAALDSDPTLTTEIAAGLLERHFPETIHPDILSAVGLSLVPSERKRDPQFRRKVLTAYAWRCAVCGFDVRLGQVSIAIDAAHIQWHQAGGPAIETNGLALCTLHHKMFDLGAFTLNSHGSVLVSEEANGSAGLQEALLQFHGKQIRAPQRPEHRPATPFVVWHGREVFRGSPRHLPE
jgi:putative restriction endonuclease